MPLRARRARQCHARPGRTSRPRRPRPAPRAEGRRDDADAVAALRKPPPVVLAANRAARDRPEAARAAVRAAERVAKSQLGSDPDGYRDALAELTRSLELLAE